MKKLLCVLAIYILKKFGDNNREINGEMYSIHSKRFDDFIYGTIYPLYMKYNKDESVRKKINDFISYLK